MNQRRTREVDFGTRFPSLRKRIAIYARVSTGLREQLESLANQVSGFVRQVYRTLGWDLWDVYIDVRSGEDRNQRSEFQRMLDACRAGEVDIILTKSLSRFGRDTVETIQAIRDLKEYNVTIIFDQENINTAEEDSEVTISLIAAYAEGENLSRRRNQLWGINKRLEDGSSELYTRQCYGYRKNDHGELEIYEPEAEVVRMVYDLYLSGASIHMIRKQLAAEGISTARGKSTWSKLAVDKLLTNEKYVGDVRVAKPLGKRQGNIEKNGGYLIENAHPAIIPRDLFSAVQTERKKRSNMVTDENGTHRKTTRYSAKRDSGGIQ